MKSPRRGRKIADHFHEIAGLPSIQRGMVGIDWVASTDHESGGCLQVALRRYDYHGRLTKAWDRWPGGTVLTQMPAGTADRELRRALRVMMDHLYWPVRRNKGWQPILHACREFSPGHIPRLD